MDKHLHSTSATTDRLTEDGGRVLRSGTKKTEHPRTGADQTSSEKKHDASTQKLEKEFDMLTDPKLLHDARDDQQGQSTLPSCRLLSIADLKQGSGKELVLMHTTLDVEMHNACEPLRRIQIRGMLPDQMMVQIKAAFPGSNCLSFLADVQFLGTVEVIVKLYHFLDGNSCLWWQ